MAKLKDLIKENFSILGGVVSTPAINRGSGVMGWDGKPTVGLADIVEDIYGSQEKVSAKEIKERGYNLDIKNPFQEVNELASPEELLDKYRATESNISSIQEKIINVLNEALK